MVLVRAWLKLRNLRARNGLCLPVPRCGMLHAELAHAMGHSLQLVRNRFGDQPPLLQALELAGPMRLGATPLGTPIGLGQTLALRGHLVGGMER